MESTDRRQFLTTGAALAAGGLLFGDWTPAQAAGLSKRTLGRTGLRVTTLGLGTMNLSDDAHKQIVSHAIEKGINLVHTAPDYKNGKSMRVVGAALKGKRSSVYLAVKCSPSSVDTVLKAMGTDHIDLLLPDSGDFSESVRAQVAAVKKAGKVRFAGFACHTGMAERLKAAVSAGWPDVNLIKYNAGNKSELDAAINKAASGAKMGFIAMKVNTGGNFGAGLRALLKNTNIAAVCPGMSSLQQIDTAYAGVTGATAFREQEDREYAHYAATCAGKLCSSCGHCDAVCPRQVSIADYLRADLYRGRGDGDYARELLLSIPARHSVAACNHCGQCNHACHKHLDVMSLVGGLKLV